MDNGDVTGALSKSAKWIIATYVIAFVVVGTLMAAFMWLKQRADVMTDALLEEQNHDYYEEKMPPPASSPPAPAPPPPPPPPPPYSAAPPAKMGSPATPLNNRGSWITSGDYPEAALVNGMEGTTGLSLIIHYRGHVRDCNITTSSGHDILDQAACEAIIKRARFHPAMDGNARPVEGYYSTRVKWVSP